MARNPFEEFKRLIAEEGRTVGPVANLHGTIAELPLEEGEERPQGWWAAQIETSAMPTLAQWMEAYTYQRPTYETLDAEHGQVRYPSGRAPLPPGRAVFLGTTVRLGATREVPLRISAPGYEIALYLGPARYQSGHDLLEVAPEIGAGEHFLALLLYGGSETILVEATPDVELSRQEPVPAPPTWQLPPEVFMLDPERGALLNRLTWNNDPLASAWQVYRSATTPLGSPTQLALLEDGSFRFRLAGWPRLEPGTELYADYFRAGRVLESEQQGESEHTGWTLVTLAPAEDAADLAFWEGQTLWRPEPFDSLQYISKSGGGTVRFDDTGVRADRIYLYRVTAYGFLGISESEYSDTEWVLTNDHIPPGPITLHQVTVEGHRVTVDYTAPEDEDFWGLRIYGEYPLDTEGEVDPPFAFDPSSLVATIYGEPGRRGQFSFLVNDETMDGAFFFASFDLFGNEQPPQDEVDEIRGTPIPGAVYWIYDGPNDAEFAADAAIELNVDDERSNPPEMELIVLDVYPQKDRATPPQDVVLKVWINGLLQGPEQVVRIPDNQIPAGTPFRGEFTRYEVAMYRAEGSKDTRLVAVAKGKDVRPFTATYLMDRDPFPGVSGVHVQDGLAFPKIWATMDDDARWLRLLRAPFRIPEDVLWVTTRQKTTQTALVANEYDKVTMRWDREVTHPAEPMALDSVEEMRLDASRDGLVWKDTVWTGQVQGPILNIPAITIRVTVERDAYPEKHHLQIGVQPIGATVAATLTDAQGEEQPVTLLPAKNGQGQIIQGQYTYTLLRAEYDQTLIIDAVSRGVGVSQLYRVDADDLPGASVSVEDLRARPLIRVTMDDDAGAVELRKVTDKESPDTSAESPKAFLHRGETGLITLRYVYPETDALATGQEELWRVYAHAENSANPDPAAWRRVWEGAVQGPPLTTNTATVLIRAVSTQTVGGVETHHLSIQVAPADAAVTATLIETGGYDTNGAPLELTETALTLGGTQGNYTYALARSETRDRRLRVTASKPGLQSAEGAYVLDRDDRAELVYVSVADRRSPAVITAMVDDDTKRLRFVDYGTDGAFVKYLPSGTGHDTLTNKTRVLTQELAPDEEREIAIEITRDPNATQGSASWREVFYHRLKGPTKNTVTPVLTIDAVESEASAALTVRVDPADCTLQAKLDGATLSGSTTPKWLATATPGEYTVTIPRTSADRVFTVTATRPGTDLLPATARYVLDADEEPALAAVAVEDRRKNAKITAYVDDDTKALRFVRVQGASRTPDAEIDTSVQKTAVRAITLARDEEQTWAIELKGRAGGPFSAFAEVWRQTLKGEPGRLTLTWSPAAADPGYEAVRLVASSEGTPVAITWRTYPKGTTPGAWQRTPASGFSPDPLSHLVSAPLPANGSLVVLEAIGYDSSGGETALLRLEIDADEEPSGTLSATVDERTGECRVTANTLDTDSGSYRYRVAKGPIGSASFAAVAWSDAAGSGEFAGTDFGVPRTLPATYRLSSGEELFVEGYFLRTTSLTGAAQQASLSSTRQRVSVPLGMKKYPANLTSFSVTHDPVGNRVIARAVQGEGAQSVVIRIANNESMVGATSATLSLSSGEAVHTLPTPAAGTYYADAVPWTDPGGTGQSGPRYRADTSVGTVQPLTGNALALVTQRWGPGIGGRPLELEVQYGTTVRSIRVQYAYSSVPGGATDRPVNYVISPIAAGGGTSTYTLEDEFGSYRMWPAGEYPSGLVLTPYDGVGASGVSGVPIYMGISMEDVPVSSGGTGRKTLTTGALMVGAGTAPVSFVSPGTPGTLLKSVGGSWTAGTLSTAEIAAGTGAPGGGQLLYSPFSGDLQYTAGGNPGDVPTLQAGGTILWKAPATGGGATLPTVTTSDNGKHLQVRGGAWALSNLVWPTLIGVQGQVIVASASGQPTWGSAPVPSLSGHSPGTGLTGSTYNGSAAVTWNVDFGTGSNQVARGNHTHSEYFGAAGGTFTGTVRFTGAVSESVLGQTRLDVGIGSGTPRLLFEQGGSVYGMDYTSGQFRWYTPGVVRMQLSTGGNLSLPWGSVTATTFYTSSQRAKKRDILPFLDDALGIVRRTNVVRYHWREGEDTSWRVGFIAEDTDTLLAGEAHDRMDVPNAVGVLLRAVQQLEERLERLERSGGIRGY